MLSFIKPFANPKKNHYIGSIKFSGRFAPLYIVAKNMKLHKICKKNAKNENWGWIEIRKNMQDMQVAYFPLPWYVV